ncbi:MAG: galactonate oxidoreductase, partial [Providencia sp.]
MSIINTLVCQEPKKLIWEKRSISEPNSNEAKIKI